MMGRILTRLKQHAACAAGRPFSLAQYVLPTREGTERSADISSAPAAIVGKVNVSLQSHGLAIERGIRHTLGGRRILW